MVESQRHQNWMIYALPGKRPSELEANLKCLQDCVQSETIFKADLAKLKKVMAGRGVREVLAQSCGCK